MSDEVAVSKHQHLLFLGSDMKNIKKIFLLDKLCFSLHFISDFIPLDPDPTGSGATSLLKCI